MLPLHFQHAVEVVICLNLLPEFHMGRVFA